MFVMMAMLKFLGDVDEMDDGGVSQPSLSHKVQLSPRPLSVTLIDNDNYRMLFMFISLE